jgi:hypothetical protein
MTQKKIDSFKVADKHPPRVKPSQAQSTAGATPTPSDETQTLGFARIEELLDTAQPGDMQRSLVGLIDDLDAYMAETRSQKDRAQGKKAKMAVERTIDLLTYLFSTKEAMIASFGQTETKKPKPQKRGP